MLVGSMCAGTWLRESVTASGSIISSRKEDTGRKKSAEETLKKSDVNPGKKLLGYVCLVLQDWSRDGKGAAKSLWSRNWSLLDWDGQCSFDLPLSPLITMAPVTPVTLHV
jgi:hypothetical protein